jgi:putative ABC transport system permease protein
MIGVGLVTFITILAASTKASLNATIDRAFTGDFVVDPGGGEMGGVDPGLGRRIAALPEVSGATAIRMGMASVDGKVVSLVAADPATAFDIVDVQPLRGSTAALDAADVIAVHEDVANDKGLDIGDTLPMLFKDSGVQQLRVGLIYGENRPGGDYILGMPAYEANFANRLDFAVYVKKAPDATIAATQQALEAVAADYPGTEVLDQEAVKDAMAQEVNQVLALVYALLALAIVIALLGIGNTLALSIFERTRELGLLRAVGMTRSQLRSAVRWESVVIALQGTALGLLVGVFFGWALILALADQDIDQFRIPLQQLALVVILAGVAGVVAAILPARRAAHLNVLQAITHD